MFGGWHTGRDRLNHGGFVNDYPILQICRFVWYWSIALNFWEKRKDSTILFFDESHSQKKLRKTNFSLLLKGRMVSEIPLLNVLLSVYNLSHPPWFEILFVHTTTTACGYGFRRAHISSPPHHYLIPSRLSCSLARDASNRGSGCDPASRTTTSTLATPSSTTRLSSLLGFRSQFNVCHTILAFLLKKPPLLGSSVWIGLSDY